jgi:hypothetical protein
MDVNKVSEIPEIEYRFQLSEETKKVIALLKEMNKGDILQFRPDEYSDKSLKIQLREIRDRLKSAMRKLDDDFIVRRRKNKYYVKRLSGVDKPSFESKIRLAD